MDRGRNPDFPGPPRTDPQNALFLLPKMTASATLVQERKQSSSKHAKTLGSQYGAFGWQRGYALFSVSPTARDAVKSYVARQVEHHHHTTFQEELRQLLERAGLEYDERYLWDCYLSRPFSSLFLGWVYLSALPTGESGSTRKVRKNHAAEIIV